GGRTPRGRGGYTGLAPAATPGGRCGRRTSRRLRPAGGVDRREVGGDVGPGVAGVFADPKRPGGAAEDQGVAGVVDVEGVAVDQVVGVAVGQAAGEDVEGLAAVGG